MSYQASYSALDRPDILRFIFYPRNDSTQPPPNAVDHSITMESGIPISCRFYVYSQNSPSIILFHGNGEVASDYDYIAPIYNQLSINLFVADYRGYGSSGGTPTFTNMVADAPAIFTWFINFLKQNDHTGDLFIMGRSLGSISAIELACRYHGQIKGLISESGFASIIRLFSHLGFPTESIDLKDVEFPNLAKIRTVTLPTLIIHGEYDNLIPLSEAKDLFRNVATKDKRLVIIPRADHNNIMMLDMEQYFAAIRDFVSGE